ncbi:hypothetical protein D3C81_2110250 [compost metagenome]
MAAQIKKVIIYANRWYSKNIAPDIGQLVLCFIPRSGIDSLINSAFFGLWQSLVIHLTVRRKRQAIHEYPIGRNHIIRKKAG